MLKWKIKGLTLLETIVAVAILTVIIYLTVTSVLGIRRLYANIAVTETTRSQASIALGRIIKDLRDVPNDELMPHHPNDSNSLKFRKFIGLDEEGKKQFAEYVEWTFDHVSAREIDNGRDDNDNGLIDEGNLIRRVYDKNGKVVSSSIFCRNIMEKDRSAAPSGLNGISFSRVGNSKLIAISISICKVASTEAAMNTGKKFIRVNLATMIALR